MNMRQKIFDIYDEDAPRKVRRQSCECGDDLPGQCPGVQNCPYSSCNDDAPVAQIPDDVD